MTHDLRAAALAAKPCHVCGIAYRVGAYAEHRVVPAHLTVIKEKDRSRTAKARKAWRERTGYVPYHKALRAENERLRAALTDLVKWVMRYEATGMIADEIAMRASLDEARAALEGKPTE